MPVVMPTDSPKETPVEPVVEPTQGEPILFAASINEDADTRSMINNTTYGNKIVYGMPATEGGAIAEFHDGIEAEKDLKQSGFGVYAFYTGKKQIDATGDDKPTAIEDKEIVMLNQEVEWDDTNTQWTYSPKRFWPGNQSYISFFAYAPYTDSSSDPPYIGKKYDGVSEEYDYRKWDSDPDDPMYGTVTYLSNKDIITPVFYWKNEDQKDLLWGMARDNKNDALGEQVAAKGFPYKNIHRLSDGTLNWDFKHALARVKFSIVNFTGILDAYKSVAAGIPKGEFPAIVNGNSGIVYVGYTGEDTNIEYYEDAVNPQYTGYYAFLHEAPDNTSVLCHKFVDTNVNNVRLVITSVTLKNLVTSATLHYDNTSEVSVDNPAASYNKWLTADAWKPRWERKSIVKQDYQIKEALNKKLYVPESTFDGISSASGIDWWNHWWEEAPFVDTDTEPLIAVDNASKEHYLLMVPRSKDESVDERLEIVINYRVISKFTLAGSYSISSGAGDTRVLQDLNGGAAPSSKFSMTGVSGVEGQPMSVSIPITIDLEENHSYHIAMRLGKVMKVMFEVTQWDNGDNPITIEVPSFE